MSAPHRPLLGRLADRWFNEVIATDALRLVLDHAGSREAFLTFVGESAGTDLGMVQTFECEHRISDGRIDLEGVDAEGRPRLVVEAKLGHWMSTEQMGRYLAHQRAALAGASGVLMLLVPTNRLREAQTIMDGIGSSIVQDPTIRPVVLSWEACLDAIAQNLPDGAGPVSAAADVAQLTAMCHAFAGWVAPPAAVASSDRQEHLRVLLEKLTERLREDTSWVGPLVTRVPGHTYRYFGLEGSEDYFSVGIVPGLELQGGTPLWLRLPQATPDLKAWEAALRRSSYRDQIWRMQGDLWLPLHLGEGLGGPDLIEHLAKQVGVVLTVVKGTGGS